MSQLFFLQPPTHYTKHFFPLSKIPCKDTLDEPEAWWAFFRPILGKLVSINEFWVASFCSFQISDQRLKKGCPYPGFEVSSNFMFCWHYQRNIGCYNKVKYSLTEVKLRCKKVQSNRSKAWEKSDVFMAQVTTSKLWKQAHSSSFSFRVNNGFIKWFIHFGDFIDNFDHFSWFCLGRGRFGAFWNWAKRYSYNMYNWHPFFCQAQIKSSLNFYLDCVRTSTWCTHDGSAFRAIDCDLDGVKDCLCTDKNKNIWTKLSSNNFQQDNPGWAHCEALDGRWCRSSTCRAKYYRQFFS